MRKTWMDSSVFPPETWSVFNIQTRTNNHLEGWHRHLNAISKPNMEFYPLIDKLHALGNHVELQVNLLRENQLNVYIKAQYEIRNVELFELWNDFNDGIITVNNLLTKLALMKS